MHRAERLAVSFLGVSKSRVNASSVYFEMTENDG